MSHAPPANPSTPDEWRHAAALARTWLLINDARLYGLIKVSPDFRVDADRCAATVEKAASLGVVPTEEEVNACINAVLAGLIPNPTGDPRCPQQS